MFTSDDLLWVVPPPPGEPSVPDWGTIEGRLGMVLPDDYKWLVGQYGPGKFDDFLHVLQPESPFRAIRLEHAMARSFEILSRLKCGGEIISHEVAQLLPVATTDNGDTVYWVTRGEADPNLWTITVNAARNTKWPEFQGGIVEFLASVLVGELRLDVFPRSFPGLQPKFARYVIRSR